jgi:hypothetical protein
MPKLAPYDVVQPDPSLIESLRSVGYSLPAAVADIVDNSIAAQAKNISITFHWAGRDSRVVILDNGCGMAEAELRAAMRPGSRNPLEERDPKDLGRFGLGLKTASLSQCRKLCVASKPARGSLSTRTWDLDALADSPEWRLLHDPPPAAQASIQELDATPKGTAVIWSDLDRIIGNEHPGDAIAHARFNDAIDQVRDHLSLTFHRFLEARSFQLSLNGRPILPWNPFMMSGRVSASTRIGLDRTKSD